MTKAIAGIGLMESAMERDRKHYLDLSYTRALSRITDDMEKENFGKEKNIGMLLTKAISLMDFAKVMGMNSWVRIRYSLGPSALVCVGAGKGMNTSEICWFLAVVGKTENIMAKESDTVIRSLKAYGRKARFGKV